MPHAQSLFKEIFEKFCGLVKRILDSALLGPKFESLIGPWNFLSLAPTICIFF